MGPVSANISYRWFDKGAPSPAAGGMLTCTNAATSRLPATMAGPQ